MQSAICMKHLIKKDSIKAAVKPYVAIVVDFILKLMNDYDHEDMIGTLEMFVNEYTEEVRPYATALTSKLAEAFLRISQTLDQDDDDSANDNILVATNCLETIYRVVDIVKMNAEIVAQLETIVVPCINVVLK